VFWELIRHLLVLLTPLLVNCVKVEIMLIFLEVVLFANLGPTALFRDLLLLLLVPCVKQGNTQLHRVPLHLQFALRVLLGLIALALAFLLHQPARIAMQGPTAVALVCQPAPCARAAPIPLF